jgi:hypothetical protein
LDIETDSVDRHQVTVTLPKFLNFNDGGTHVSNPPVVSGLNDFRSSLGLISGWLQFKTDERLQEAAEWSDGADE